MSTLALRNYGLVLPSNYVSIEKDEMEYIDGGFHMSTTTASRCIDIAIAVITFGFAAGITIKSFIANYSVATAKSRIVKCITKVGLSASLGYLAYDLISTVLDFTFGKGIAYLLDGIDKDGRNGYITF